MGGHRLDSVYQTEPNVKQNSACQTKYLGWDAPLIPAAARFLCDRYGDSLTVDLSSLVCVLPSARSLSTLKHRLRIEADHRGCSVELPTTVTIGQFAEYLYEPDLPLALEFEQTLAWATVLRAMPGEELKPLVPVVIDPESIGPWVEFGGTLRRLHELLAANRLSFTDVAGVA